MKKSVVFISITILIAMLNGCILSKSPSTNNVTMNVGEQKTFSVSVFPPATYTWTLDEAPIPNTTQSYTYTALTGIHTLNVKAKHFLGTDTQTWTVVIGIKIFGGSKLVDSAWAVQQTEDGGFILAGYTWTFGTSEYDCDAWLIKTDVDGNKVWDKTFGGIIFDSEYADSVQQTSDGGYILAGYTYDDEIDNCDAWIIKTDENGNKLWDKTFIRSWDDRFYGVHQTSDGGYILVGWTWSYVTEDYNAWLVKTDEDGNKLWDKTFEGNQYAEDVQQTSDGGYILTGYNWSYEASGRYAWLIKTDADGNNLWNRTFGESYYNFLYTVQQVSDNGYIMAGEKSSNAWLIKADAYGNCLWDKTFKRAVDDRAYAAQQTNDGGYILAGYTSHGVGDNDFWLIKTDSNGNKLWDKTFGGSGWDVAYAIQQTSDGGYILAGETSSYYAGQLDVMLLKTDENGNAQATPTP